RRSISGFNTRPTIPTRRVQRWYRSSGTRRPSAGQQAQSSVSAEMLYFTMILGVLEILRSIFLPDDEAAVLVREVRLHRREGGAGREPRLLLRRQRRQPRQFREAREIALAHREVPAVQMQPTAEDVLARFEDDLPVREIRFPLPLRELV